VSIRQDALDALVTILQGITPAAGFSFDLSPPGAVDQGVLTRSLRVESTQSVHVQVQEGTEEHKAIFVSPDTEREVLLELVLDLMLRGSRDEPPRQRLNRLIADVNKRVGQTPTLNNKVQRAHIARVAQPAYDPAGDVAFVAVHVVADYHYMAGTTI